MINLFDFILRRRHANTRKIGKHYTPQMNIQTKSTPLLKNIQDNIRMVSISNKPEQCISDVPPLVSSCVQVERPLRLAIAGNIASGKSTLANNIVVWGERNNMDIRRIGFGDAVKYAAQCFFNKDQTIHKDRPLLLGIGTKMREIDPDVWINIVIRTVEDNPHTHWIVDDLRFHNEFEALRNAGFMLVKLDVPEHVRFGRIVSKYSNEDAEHHIRADLHESEQEVAKERMNHEFDAVVQHNHNTTKNAFCYLLGKHCGFDVTASELFSHSHT